MRNNVRNLVFDVSGVLRNSKAVMKKSYEVAFEEAGVRDVKLDIDMIYRMRGLPSFNDLRNSIRLLLGTKGDIHESVVASKGADSLLLTEMQARPVDEELVQNIRDRFRTEFGKMENQHLVTLLPGVAEGIKRLADSFTLGVISNSTQASLERDLGPLAPYFTFMISDAAKPDPTVYLHALRKHNLLPEETAYVGDALSDVDLARASGSVSVAILTGMGTRKHLEAARPDVICQDFEQLLGALGARAA